MRRTALIGISLTLLMLLLVLSSAFIFVFQGRQQLIADRESAESSLSQTQQELDITYDTLDTSGRALATAEATNLILEGQLVESQQELDAASSTIATRESEIAVVSSERDQILSRPPSIEIIAPSVEASLLLGEPVEYDIVVADGVGVTAVLVSIDGEQIDAYSLPGNPTERILGEWTPTEVGDVILGVQASNSRTSILVTRTLSIDVPLGQLVPLGEAPFRTERLAVETAVQDARQLQLDDSVDISVNFQNNQEQRQDNVPLLASLTVTESLSAWSLFDLTIDDFFLAETAVSFRYNSQQDTLNISGLGASFDPIDAYDYAGAYSALLLDQNYTAVDSRFLPLDAQMVQQSLIAGDVANSQANLLASNLFSQDDLTSLNANLEARQLPIFELTLQQGGLQFASFFAAEDRLEALNEAWQSLPTTTEQIFHPEKYLAQETAVAVTLEDVSSTLGEGWNLLVSETAGEGLLRVYLSRYLNEAQVDTAVSGWGGDRFEIYQNEETDESVLVLKIVWDSVEDSNEFSALYPNYPTRLLTAAGTLNDLGECWSGDDVICLFQSGIETAVVRAPSEEIALEIGATLLDD